MKIFIAGQKAFGAAVFELCRARGHEVVGVCAPAHRLGGTAALLPDRLRQAAEGAAVPWLLSGQLNAETLPDGFDLVIAAHSHDFIGRRTRLRARLGGIGYHPSLLPLHRGRDAIRWALHMGNRITGGSIYWLSDNTDGGDIAAQDWCFVRPDDDAETLWRRELFPIGIRLFDRVLADLEHGLVVAVPQDESLATWEPSWERPPLRRPDLLMLSAGSEPRLVVQREPTALHRF
jgi:methionyl-tRNA formyltransferase